jgi:hypothetical protein
MKSGIMIVIDIHVHDIFVIQMSFHVNNTGTMHNIKAYFVEQKMEASSITGTADEKGFKTWALYNSYTTLSYTNMNGTVYLMY